MSKKKNSSSIVKVLTQMVLDIFEQNGNTPLNYKQVSAKLNVRDPDSRDIIFGILRDETKTGALKEVAPGKFQLLELKTFIEGKVDLTNDGSAFIITDDEFESDIFVAPRKLRNALNGDRVKVYVYAKSKGKHKEDIATRQNGVYRDSKAIRTLCLFYSG
jgi:ribonuclease R